jgi:hypothetical protein
MEWITFGKLYITVQLAIHLLMLAMSVLIYVTDKLKI